MKTNYCGEQIGGGVVKPKLWPIGTRIQFAKTLDSGPDDYSPGNLYAVKGDFGTITGHGTREGYWVEWDGWKGTPFGASEDEFKVVDEK